MHQCTDLEALDARLAAGAVTAYVGYDCTADSLHVGSLLAIMLLRLFQQMRAQADRVDGRRHHADRRSVRQG